MGYQMSIFTSTLMVSPLVDTVQCMVLLVFSTPWILTCFLKSLKRHYVIGRVSKPRAVFVLWQLLGWWFPLFVLKCS